MAHVLRQTHKDTDVRDRIEIHTCTDRHERQTCKTDKQDRHARQTHYKVDGHPTWWIIDRQTDRQTERLCRQNRQSQFANKRNIS